MAVEENAQRIVRERSGIDLSRPFRRAPHVVATTQGEETIVLHPKLGRFHTLDAVGTRVWQLLGAGLTPVAIVTTIVGEFALPSSVTRDQVDSDVAGLINLLLAAGLLEQDSDVTVNNTPPRAERRLPILEDRDTSTLPPLYDAWIREILGGPVLPEAHATCADCAMAKSAGATTVSTVRFSSRVKCCSFVPTLPNFLVGRILGDETPGNASGRESIERRIATGEGVTPFGLVTPRDYSLIYDQTAGALFGRSGALGCPHFLAADGGLCSIWQHRNSVCATYFCKFERGALGQTFWNDLCRLLDWAERRLALWCLAQLCDLRELGEAFVAAEGHLVSSDMEPWIPTDSVLASNSWNGWAGRQSEFFRHAWRLVDALPWDSLKRIAGLDCGTRLTTLRTSYERTHSFDVPRRLRLGAVAIVPYDTARSVVSGYSVRDMLIVPTPITRLLPYFDGERDTASVLAHITRTTRLSIDQFLIRELVDFGVLIPMPDLPELANATDQHG